MFTLAKPSNQADAQADTDCLDAGDAIHEVVQVEQPNQVQHGNCSPTHSTLTSTPNITSGGTSPTQ